MNVNMHLPITIINIFWSTLSILFITSTVCNNSESALKNRNPNKSATQLRPPPAPNYNHLAKACPSAQWPTLLPFSRLSYPGRLFTQSPLLTTQSSQSPSLMTQLPPHSTPTMSTMATRTAGWQRQIKAKQAEDMVAFQQMEQECQQRLQEKKKRAEE